MKSSCLKKQRNHTSHVPEPIRVMHVIDKLSVSGSKIHGITKAFEWWIASFDTQQFQFSVCSLRIPEAAGEILEKQGASFFFLSSGKFDPRTLTRLLAVIKQQQPHILHLHGYGASHFGCISSLITGIPNIVHEHVVIPNQPLYQTVADWILSPLTTKAIAISKSVREFMIDRRKVKAEILDTFLGSFS